MNIDYQIFSLSQKFVQNLLLVGYSSQFMGGIPVYGYGGREPLRARDAYFIFLDKLFGSYRENTQKNRVVVTFVVFRLRKRVRCQKIRDKLSSIQRGQRQ